MVSGTTKVSAPRGSGVALAAPIGWAFLRETVARCMIASCLAMAVGATALARHG